MPKNFVGRLQDLENEMKTVLSICDGTNHGINSNKRMQKSIRYPVQRSSSNLDTTIIGKVNAKIEGPGRFTAEGAEPQKGFVQKIQTKCPYEKSNSPPGQMVPMKMEGSVHLCKRIRYSGYSPTVTRRNETVESVESSEWFDCSTQSTQNQEAEPTEEQTLRPVEQILADISQLGSVNHFSKRPNIWCATCRRRAFECTCRGRQISQTHYRTCEQSIQEEVDESRESFIHNIKPNLQTNPLINELVREIEIKEMEAKSIMNMNIQRPLKSHQSDPTVIQQRKYVQFKNEDGCYKGNDVDIGCSERVLVPLDGNKNVTHPATVPANMRKVERSQFTNRTIDKNEPRRNDREQMMRNNPNRDLHQNPCIKGNLNLIPEEQQSETGNDAIIQETVHCEGNVQNVEYPCSDVESSPDSKEDIVHLKQKKNLSDATTRKIADIIQKNHEKIERMRKSKSLALNTVRVMKGKYDEMEQIKNELTEKFGKLLEENKELMKQLKETDASKQQIIQEWENYKKENSSRTLLDKLESVNQENLQCKEKIQTLEQQLQEKKQWTDESGNNNGSIQKISDLNQDKYYEYHILFKRQEEAHRRLVEGIAVLEKVITNNKEKEKRLAEIKAELKLRTAKTRSCLEKLTSEKTELIEMVNKLRTFAEEQKSKIDELYEEINKKDEELEKQKKLLEEKSENLEGTNRELESIRKTSTDLEDQVKTLRKSIENFDKMHQNLLKERQGFENILQQIKEENKKLQEELSAEKESIQIKNKIIEDQQETIKQLKEKSDEVKKMVEKVQSLERLINIEREEKLEQQDTIERLRRKKDELRQKVKSLEADLLLAPQEVVRDLQKTQIVLHELENQVQIKQKEWQILLQSLMKEKEQACSVAAFATKKLFQTTSDFQKQSDSQKKLYRLLAENMMEKKNSFHDATEKAVRFSEDLLQSHSNKEHRTHSQRLRLHQKQVGILKKSREWLPRSRYPLESFSNINLNKFRGQHSAEDVSESDELCEQQI